MNRKIFTIISFAVMMFLLGTWAATAQVFPVTADFLDDIEFSSFLPLVLKDTTADPVPSGVLYVFSSTATTNGNAGGRSKIQQICPNEDSDAHFCNVYEIENAWTTSGVVFKHPFPRAWIDYPNRLGTLVYTTSGYPYLSDWVGAITCNAWTTDQNIIHGRIIEDSAFDVAGEFCNESLPTTCCKWIP